MSLGLLLILVCHAEYEAKHIVACDFTNEIVFPALKSAKSCQTVNIVHLSEQKVIFYRASFASPWWDSTKNLVKPYVRKQAQLEKMSVLK